MHSKISGSILEDKDVVKKTPIILPCIFMFSAFFTFAGGAIEDRGRVNMQGSIIDSACSIAVESREQTIEMKVISLSDIARDGRGPNKDFSIHLIGCILNPNDHSGLKKFQMTFDGDADGDYFDVYGTASGVGIEIIDSFGNVASPGKTVQIAEQEITDNKINYVIRLMHNSDTLRAGEYFSSIRFKLDYF